MDIGREVVTKAITSTEAERVFQPWFVTAQHYLVYSLVGLGVMAYPINCMLSSLGNCSYDVSHPNNYLLPYSICRIDNGNQVVLQSEHLTNSTLASINVTMGIYAAFRDESFFYLNVTRFPYAVNSILSMENIERFTQRNAKGCFVKQNPRLFPWHVYYYSVNQLSSLVLYFPYLIIALAFLFILMERLLTRFFWTGQRIERFYQLMVKEAIKDGVSLSSLHSRSTRMACQQILFDFRGSSIYYRSYIFQTIGKFGLATSVLSWSLAKQCNQLRKSYSTILHSEVLGFMHYCTIPANGMNLVIFDIVNVVMLMLMVSALFTLLWYLRILLPGSCHGLLVNTKLGKVINRYREQVNPVPCVIDTLYFKSLDMRLLLNILTETKGLWSPLLIFCLFDGELRHMLKPQLDRVSSSSSHKGRRNMTVRWREPLAAALTTASLKQSHTMYVAEITPPSENEEMIKMVPAACVLDENESYIFGRDTDLEDNNPKEDDKKSVATNPDTDITVVESVQNRRYKKNKLDLEERIRSRSRVNSRIGDELSASPPYLAVFKNLRLDTDYKISLSYVMSGHTLGVVEFTVAAEKRKTSTDSCYSSAYTSSQRSSSSCSSRKESDFSVSSEDSENRSQRESVVSSISERERKQAVPSINHVADAKSTDLTQPLRVDLLDHPLGADSREEIGLHPLIEEDEGNALQVIRSEPELRDKLKENNDKGLVVLTIGAQWCKVCEKMQPGLEKLSREMSEVLFLYADINEVPDLSVIYSIVAYPTTFIVKSESVIERVIGDQKETIEKKLRFLAGEEIRNKET